METALTESTALSQKCEREYIVLRDSIQGLVDGWKTDTEKLREEMRKREEKLKKEAEIVGHKYKKLVEDVRMAQTERGTVKDLIIEDDKVTKEIEDGFREEIKHMKEELEKSTKDSDEAGQTAR
jgi:hypothetical protein